MGTTVKIMLNTDRSLANGSFPLVVRILHNRRKKMIYMPYHLFRSDFDPKVQKVLFGMHSQLTPNRADQINREAEATKQQIEHIVSELKRETQGAFTLDQIIDRWEPARPTTNVLAYIDREIALMRAAGRFGSASLYATTKNSLSRFLNHRTVTFAHLNGPFVVRYAEFLRSTDLSHNTVNMYLRNLRTLYYKAQKEGLFTASLSPFEHMDIRVSKAAKNALSKESMCRIAGADFAYDESLELVRDVFMFSFYSLGMSFVDIIHLRSCCVVQDTICCRSMKNNLPIRVHITPPLRVLIDKYRTESPFVFPILHDDSGDALYKQYRNALNVINYNLKRIGVLLDLEHKLTTHVARHSWERLIQTQAVSLECGSVL